MRLILRDSAANVAIITALCALPLFGIMGLAINYAITLSTKAKVDSAADAAAVVAVTTAQTAIQGGSTTAAATTQAQAQATKAFAANTGSTALATVSAPTVTLTRNGQTLAATVSYNTTVSSNLGKLFGMTQLNAAGSSTTTLTMTTFINYYIVVDISQSMGIGATQTDMANLYNRTEQYGNGGEGDPGCVFGCHVPGSGQTVSNEYLAHNVSPTITLRIDSAVAAIKNIISLAQTNAGTQGNIKIALYTMSGDPVTGNKLNVIAAPPSNNYSSLTTAAGTIDLGNNETCCGYGDSDFPDSLSQFNSVLTAQGDGSSALSPLNYVFIITDGMQDTYGSSCTWGHCIQAMNPSLCTPLKSKATVGVIYTTYLPVYQNNIQADGYENSYAVLAQSTVPSLAPALQACATSTSYYFEAVDGPSITTAMQSLFVSTSAPARIAQ